VTRKLNMTDEELMDDKNFQVSADMRFHMIKEEIAWVKGVQQGQFFMKSIQLLCLRDNTKNTASQF
jgi:hypothetical protein